LDVKLGRVTLIVSGMLWNPGGKQSCHSKEVARCGEVIT